MDIAKRTTTYQVEDRSWLGSAHGTEATESITLDVSAFTSGTHYPNGYLLSGLPLGKITASGLYGPYGASPSEVQTLTFDATGGVYTVGFDGSADSPSLTYLNTTGDTAVILAALEGLSTINPGDVTVSRGTPAGNVTIFTVTFGGRYVGQNVPTINITETLTGGSATLAAAQGTAGGGSASNGTEVLVGHLFSSVPVHRDSAGAIDTATDVGGAILTHGKIRSANLPVSVDAAGQADVAGRIRYI